MSLKRGTSTEDGSIKTGDAKSKRHKVERTQSRREHRSDAESNFGGGLQTKVKWQMAKGAKVERPRWKAQVKRR